MVRRDSSTLPQADQLPRKREAHKSVCGRCCKNWDGRGTALGEKRPQKPPAIRTTGVATEAPPPKCRSRSTKKTASALLARARHSDLFPGCTSSFPSFHATALHEVKSRSPTAAHCSRAAVSQEVCLPGLTFKSRRTPQRGRVSLPRAQWAQQGHPCSMKVDSSKMWVQLLWSRLLHPRALCPCPLSE